MITAKLFNKRGTLTIDAAYDAYGKIIITGPPLFVTGFIDWLETAIGFAGHGVGYPWATPRNLHAALISDGAQWSVSDIQVDDAKPLPPLPAGAVS